MTPRLQLIARVYRGVLRLYPPMFYRRYAADMHLDFAQAYSDALSRGRRATAACLSRVCEDIIVSVPREWLRTDRPVVIALALGACVGLWAVVGVVAAGTWPNGPATTGMVMNWAALLAAIAAITLLCVLFCQRDTHWIHIAGTDEPAAVDWSVTGVYADPPVGGQ